MKFERMMKKLCKDLGVDKKTLLSMYFDPATHQRDIENSNLKSDSGYKEMNRSRDSGTITTVHNLSH